MQPVYGGIDLGGTNIACALGRPGGDALIERTIPTLSNLGPDGVLARVGDLLLEMTHETGERPIAIGMGVPGLADRQTGHTLFLPNFPTQWRNVPVANVLSARVGCPVYLLNDARIATLGEMVFGSGPREGTMLFLTLGTGVGGGIVIDGKLRLGPLGSAGEMGHQTILPNGPLCGCGNYGCLEALASGPAITGEGVRLMKAGMAPKLHELTRGQIASVGPKEMAVAASEGDRAVEAAIVRASTYIGIGIANMVTAIHPDVVVLGGGVSAIGSLLIETVRATIQARVRMFPVDNLVIEQSRLRDKAGIYGGIALAMQSGNC